MAQAIAYAVAYAFTYGSPCAVAYAVVSYAEVAYTVSYDLLELNIAVFLYLIRQPGLKAFSVLLELSFMQHQKDREATLQCIWWVFN